MTTAYLGLGSNLGDRDNNIKEALRLLADHTIVIKKVSTIIETIPVGGPPQGKYLNAVLEIETDLSSHKLLEKIKSVESLLGRTRSVQNGPRTIDIDILLFGDFLIQEPSLTVPHPRMLEREFVMKPLFEIAPDIVHKLLSSNKVPHAHH